MELKFVTYSYFKQLFQNLRPKLQYSKNRIFVTSHFGALSNADVGPIKSLYFEAGSKRFRTRRKIQKFVWQVICLQMVIFQPILRIFM